MPRASEAAAWLKAHDRYAILTHLHPDGDALGSSLALQMALESLGKTAYVACQDDAPDFLDMLPVQGRLFRPENAPYPPEAIVCVDCGAVNRFGRAASLCREGLPLCCIDHHEGNDVSAQAALIDPKAAASGELIGELLDALNVPVAGDIALCLFVAVATDTGNFAFDSTTPQSFTLAARCAQAGVDIGALNLALFRRRTAARTRLLGRALDRIDYAEGGALALMRLRKEDFADCGASIQDTEGIVNFGVDTDGVEIAVLAVELEDGVKFSLRAKSRVNVAELVAPLGGGGHAKAAGLTLRVPFDEGFETVRAACMAALREAE